MHTYSLLELNNYVKQVVALNFEEPLWITCEISQVRESRGQLYLELVQQNEEGSQIVATAGAVMWYKNHLFIKRKLGELYSAILQDGTQVSLKIEVTFHERYGLKLNILDIDPAYTIGKLEMQRQQIVERLRKEGVLPLNSSLTLPSVVQRVAVISSERAAGYKDFMHQLRENAYGYQFLTTLYQVAVQGANVEQEVCDSLMQITSIADQYDCVVIIRGGGSRLDLAGFDNFNIGYHIATCPLPVITGIGHEIDNTVADIVAHTSVKTPTAAAEVLIDQNVRFESLVIDLAHRIQRESQSVVQQYRSSLEYTTERLKIYSEQLLSSRAESVEMLAQDVKVAAADSIHDKSKELDHIASLIQILDPKQVLKRGYAIVRTAGKVAASASDLSSGDPIEIELQDGSLDAIVNG